MTMESAIEMLEKAGTDEAFAEALASAVGDKEGEDTVQAVVGFASANGFDVTAGDAREAQKHFAEASEAGEGDLDDEELEGASGGNGQAAANARALAQLNRFSREFSKFQRTYNSGW